MSFYLFADSGCNLPERKLTELSIDIIPFPYVMDGKSYVSPKFPDGFDGHSYYDHMRAGSVVQTSLINTDGFLRAFRPQLEHGSNILYVGISAGISGTVQAASIAAQQLMEEFPDRTIEIVDSMGAGLGTGLLVCKAADYRNQGLSVQEAAANLREDTKNLCEYFTVDDLMFLKRTGRVSGVTAAIGSMLQIKPMLRGDETGHIVVCGKFRGRKRAVGELCSIYAQKVVGADTQRIGISHGDCLAEAQALAEKIKEIAHPKELILSMHEPLTGAHVGPGMLALFFFGNGR